MLHNVIQKLLKNRTAIVLVLTSLALPMVIAGAYVVQTRTSRASAACVPENIVTDRLSQSAARITFDTPCVIQSQVFCAIGVDGVQFLCGEDAVETNRHIIDTSDVTLSSDTPYYIYIDTNLEERTIGYIRANPVDVTVGLNADEFDDATMGLTAEDEGYDVSLDINQDGVVNGMDRSEFYPEYE